MKKLKIMLLSFAVLAVVGSALAFKARFNIKTYCTAATNGQDPASNNICTSVGGVGGEMEFCDVTITKTTADHSRGNTGIWCTTDAQDLDNGGVLDDCAVGSNKVRCLTTTTIYND